MLAVISVLVVVILYSQGVIKKQYFDLKYRSGSKALEKSEYEKAIDSFGSIKEDAPYKTDSIEMAYYKWGEALLSQNLYEKKSGDGSLIDLQIRLLRSFFGYGCYCSHELSPV